MTTTIHITADVKFMVSYGRPHKARRWYLEAVCRETGRRVNNKFTCRPTSKQFRKFKNWALSELRFSLYWDMI